MLEQKPNQQLTVVVGIIERDGRFLVTRRVDSVPMWHHKWGFPGGRVKSGEALVEALHREVREETGLEVGEPKLIGVHTHHWRLPEHTQQTFIVVYRATASRRDAVTLQADENDDYRWVSLDEFLAMDDHLEANRDIVIKLYRPAVARGTSA